MTPNGPSSSDLDETTRLIEAERRQIGHDIHDGLLPLIFAASATVSSIQNADSRQPLAGDPATQKKLEQVSQWLVDALRVGRQLLTQVYPPELVGALWTGAAKDAIERLFAECDSEIQWRVDASVDETTAPIALAAYRIVVEAVRNAIRHGESKEVVIEGEKRNSGIRVTVRDDGRGFDPAGVPDDRYGIRSMKGRAQLVGGSLRIASKPGGPTTVIFEV